jgi:DNA invertase Pin-like site-specific DNA recombinase
MIDINVMLFYNKTQLDEHKKEIEKLSQARVKLINKAINEGMSVSAIAKKLGISRQRIYKIINKKV